MPLRPVYYRASDSTQPVREFLLGLLPAHQAALRTQIGRIAALTTAGQPHLPFPYSSQVEGELREVRCHFGATHYRILYRRSRQLVVLLHAFVKATDAVPESDKRVARERWDDFTRRMNAIPRRPPRAAGRDAP